MKFNIKKFFVVLLVQVSLVAYPMTITQYPISLSVKPNIILTFDDSGSMSDTVIPDTPNPAWTSTGEDKLSSWYNKLAYDPTVNYTPYVKTVYAPNSVTTGGSLTSGYQYQVTYTCDGTSTTAPTNTIDYDTGSKFTSNTLCTQKSGSFYKFSSTYTVLSGQSWQHMDAYPDASIGSTSPIYYTKLPSGSCTPTTTQGGGNGGNGGSSLSACVTAPTCGTISSCTGPTTSGDVLKQTIITNTNRANSIDTIQNYANWKQYASTRILMVGFSMSKVLPNISGAYIGINLFNGWTSTTPNTITRGFDSSVSSVTYQTSSYAYSTSNGKTYGRMYNMDYPVDVNILLDIIYNTTPGSSTPTHASLIRTATAFGDPNLTLTTTNNDGSSYTYNKGIIQYACQKNAAFITTDGYANNSTSGSYAVLPSAITYTSSTWGNGTPYTQTTPKSLADIALAYYTNLLRTDTSVLATGQVPAEKGSFNNVDKNINLHMNTYAITLGAKGNLYGVTYVPSNAVDGTTPSPYGTIPTWVDPTTSAANNSPVMIDDLWHSTINGRGAMYNAADPTTLATSIQSGISDIVTRAANRDSIAVANSYITSANNAVYVPVYNTSSSGDLSKYVINLPTSSSPTPTVATTANWTVATKIGYQITGVVPVTNPITPTPPARKMVTMNSSGIGTSLSSGNSLRNAPFGSVINASPLAIQTGTSTIIYQAANDGLLHAIDGDTGYELWAYNPSFLKNQAVTQTNQYVLDGTPAYGYANGKTYLVGGTGFNNVHIGYYGIDITTPATSSTSEATIASNIKWEFPLANQTLYQNNLGTATSRPLIINTKAWGTVVAISSGYNNGTGTIGGVPQTGGDGKGHVWLLDPATGAVKAELVTPSGSATSPIGMASLVGFILNPRSDTTTTALYGGDSSGNVWKFNVSEPLTTNWSGTNTSKVTKIATLTDKNGLPQSVTTAPMVSADAANNNAIVYIATGQLFNNTDIASQVINSFYSIEDTGANLGRSDLLQLTSNSSGVTFPTTMSKTLVAEYKNGWFFDFTVSGERALSKINVSTGSISFTTNSITSNACTSSSYNYNFTIPPALVVNSDGSSVVPTWAITIPTGNVGTGTTSVTVNGGTKTTISTTSAANPIVVFINGKKYTLAADGTMIQVGTYTVGRQMGTWREIVRK